MTAPALKVTGINHVVLHVTDMERSRRFYVDVLGFEDRSSSAGSNRAMSFLRCGAQGLDLFAVTGGDVHGGEEMNHMALSVEAGDIEEASVALEKAGISASERTPRNTVFISDPDGHRIEILPVSAYVRTPERQVTQAGR